MRTKILSMCLLVVAACGGSIFAEPKEDGSPPATNDNINNDDASVDVPDPNAGDAAVDTVDAQTTVDAGTVDTNDSAPSVDASIDAGPAACVHNQAYYKTHPEAWPATSITLGDVLYTQDQLLGFMNLPYIADDSLVLVNEFVATLLNGGENNHVMIPYIQAAHAWLIAHKDADGVLPYDIPCDQPALDIFSQLVWWNDGYWNVPACKLPIGDAE